MTYKDVLPNGMRVLTEELPHLHSVAIGLWVAVGSAYEPEPIAGISHYLEHMLFKGTKTRNAKELAEAMESVGAQMNAFTSKEYTCYYAKSIDEDFELCLDVLSDMFFNSLFDPEEVEKEKNVILEEISMYEDSPDDVVQDLLVSNLWKTHTYGRPVIGSRSTVSDITSQKLRDYIGQSYAPTKTVLSVAGNVTRAQVLEAVDKFFDFDRTLTVESAYGEPEAASGQAFTKKEIEQTHICLGMPAIREGDEDFYAANILNTALGAGVSSRLFQEAREKRGFCYSVYSFLSTYSKGGYLAAYGSTSPAKMADLVKVIWEQMTDIKATGLTAQEIDRSKQQLKGSLLLGMENSSNVMSRMGRMETSMNRFLSVEEVVERIMKVENRDILRVAGRIFHPEKLVLAVTGPEDTKFSINELL